MCQFAGEKAMTCNVLEVNPPRVADVPFVSKAIGVPLAKLRRESHDRKIIARPRIYPGNRAEKHFSVKRLCSLFAL